MKWCILTLNFLRFHRGIFSSLLPYFSLHGISGHLWCGGEDKNNQVVGDAGKWQLQKFRLWFLSPLLVFQLYSQENHLIWFSLLPCIGGNRSNIGIYSLWSRWKTEILREVVTHSKSHRWPVAKKVSNLAQSFGRENTPGYAPRVESRSGVGSTRWGNQVKKGPLREEDSPYEINKN